MFDDNMSIDNKQDKLIEIGKTSCQFLYDMTNEFKEQFSDLNMQHRQYKNLLKRKEIELFEKERTMVYNIDLFSPNFDISHDISEDDSYSEIETLKNRLKDLDEEQYNLQDKINNIYKVSQCIKGFMEESNTENIGINKDNRNIGINILEAQEAERQRIARDLHDSTVQNLTGLVHKSEFCLKLIDIDVIRVKLELAIISNTLKSVINDMRDIIYNLKPMSLDDLGLVITVERYVNKVMAVNDINIILNYNEVNNSVTPVINLSLFRVIQEACQNIIKHARAKEIDININYMDDYIVAYIKDNGIGFNYENQQFKSSEKSSNFGLSIMKERISLLSGTMKIQSEKGKGTIITISVPLIIREEDNNE